MVRACSDPRDQAAIVEAPFQTLAEANVMFKSLLPGC
jgi:hypothetical protein